MTVAYTKPTDTVSDLTVSSAFDPMDAVKNGLNDHMHGLTTNGAERHTADMIDDQSMLETTAVSNTVSQVHARLDMLFLEVRNILSPSAANLTVAEASRVAAGGANVLADHALIATHTHDGVTSVRLPQANTHQSPDTDVATTSLHHTIGLGATQAAAGNHLHSGVYIAGSSFGLAGGPAQLDGSALLLLANMPLTVARDAAVVHNTLIGTASGVATLDGSGLIPIAQVPASLARDAVVVHTSALGAAGGVATLDGSILVPVAQIPASIARVSALSAYVLASTVGVASGVASLDSSALVPLAQIPASIARTSATSVLGHTHGAGGEAQIITSGLADFSVVGGTAAGSKLAARTVTVGNLADGSAVASGLVITFQPFQFRDINNNFVRKNSGLTVTYTSGIMPVANPRIDIIECSMTGVLTIKQGVEAAVPVEPVADTNTFGVLYVYLRVATTNIFNSDQGGANTGYIYEGRPSPGFVPAGGISATVAMPITAPVGTIGAYPTAGSSWDTSAFLKNNIPASTINGFTFNPTTYSGNEGPAAISTGPNDGNLGQMMYQAFSPNVMTNPAANLLASGKLIIITQFFGVEMPATHKWLVNLVGIEQVDVSVVSAAAGLRYIYADPAATKYTAGNMFGLTVLATVFGAAQPAAPAGTRLIAICHYDGTTVDQASISYQFFGITNPTQHRMGGLFMYGASGGTNVVNSTTWQASNGSTHLQIKSSIPMQYLMFGAIRFAITSARGLFVTGIYQNLPGCPAGSTGISGLVSMASTKTMDPTNDPDVAIPVGPQLISVSPGTNYFIPAGYSASAGVSTAYYSWLMAIPAVQ